MLSLYTSIQLNQYCSFIHKEIPVSHRQVFKFKKKSTNAQPITDEEEGKEGTKNSDKVLDNTKKSIEYPTLSTHSTKGTTNNDEIFDDLNKSPILDNEVTMSDNDYDNIFGVSIYVYLSGQFEHVKASCRDIIGRLGGSFTSTLNFSEITHLVIDESGDEEYESLLQY